MARAIVEPRKLMLIDEPTKGLAPAIIHNMIAAFTRTQGQTTTILLVEQNFRFAQALGDTVAVMDDGRIVHRGAMARARRATRRCSSACSGCRWGRTNEHASTVTARRRSPPACDPGARSTDPAAAGAGVIAIALPLIGSPRPGSRSPSPASRWA